MTDDLTSPPRRPPSVFLSYSRNDREAVRRVADRLQDAGIRIWWDELVRPGAAWDDTLVREIQSSDYVLLFVSSSSAPSMYADQAMEVALDEFNNRSITPLPVLLDDAPIPPALSNLQFIDLRDDAELALQRLVGRLQENLEIDFSSLSGLAFEDLVADVLSDLGFTTEREVFDRGMQFDFRANVRSQDPFGAMVDETWLIEVKHHSVGRLSVAAIRDFIGKAHAFTGSRLALITSGQITSAGREFISSYPVRLVEGVELRRILLTRPHLVRRHLVPHRK